MGKTAETRRDLKEVLTSAKTLEESLEAFNKMVESGYFDVSELSLYGFSLATNLDNQGNNSEKVLSLSKMALEGLEIMNKRGNSAQLACPDCRSTQVHPLKYAIAQNLTLLGFASYDSKNYFESLRYYERADKIFSEFDKEGNNCILIYLETVQLGLFEVKARMGRREDAVSHMVRVLEVRENMYEEGCMELGQAYKGVYIAYFDAMDVKEALPFCLKALEIYKKHLGCDSMEVANMMSDLGIIYGELGECEKAMEQNVLARSVLKKVAPSSPNLLKAELLNGAMLAEMGRNEEAIEILRGIASHADADGCDKANAFYSMGRAFITLGKFDDAKKYLRRAQRIYETEEMNPLNIALGFEYMSMLYEEMNDQQTAIVLSRRVIAIPKIPRKLLLKASTRLFVFVYLVGMKEEEIPYMEVAVEKLEESVGSKHDMVGCGCKVLGGCYMKSRQLELAIKWLTKAKGILDISRGPNDLESLDTSHNLVRLYAIMQRVEPAIEIEEKVVEGLKGLGPSVQELLDEAVNLLKNLNKMKEMMRGPLGPLLDVLFPNLMR